MSYYRVYDVTEHLPAAGPATLGVALATAGTTVSPRTVEHPSGKLACGAQAAV
ncbi:MAG: hypothetical protein ACLR7U_10730 [Ruthenibacterium lactatiformans]